MKIKAWHLQPSFTIAYSLNFDYLLHWLPKPGPHLHLRDLWSNFLPSCRCYSNITVGSTLLQGFMFPQNAYHHLPDSVLLLIYLIPRLISLHKNQSPQDEGCICFVWEYNAGGPCLISGLGRSPGEGNDYPVQNSVDRGAWRAIVHGVAKSGTRRNNSFIFPWMHIFRKKNEWEILLYVN